MLTAKSIRHLAWGDKDDNAENRLAVTDYLVEATNHEWFTLWARWCKYSQECREPIFKKWEQLGGCGITIGCLDKRPVVVSLNWDRLDGFLVCQWEATSQLVDYKMIEEWLDKHYTRIASDNRPASCNASNFHSCVREFEKWKELQDA